MSRDAGQFRREGRCGRFPRRPPATTEAVSRLSTEYPPPRDVSWSYPHDARGYHPVFPDILTGHLSKRIATLRGGSAPTAIPGPCRWLPGELHRWVREVSFLSCPDQAIERFGLGSRTGIRNHRLSRFAFPRCPKRSLFASPSPACISGFVVTKTPGLCVPFLDPTNPR